MRSVQTWRAVGVALAFAAIACSGSVEIVTDSGADAAQDAAADAKPDTGKDAQNDVQQSDAQGDGASDAQADGAADADGGADASLDAQDASDVVVKPDVVVIDAGPPDVKPPPPPDGGVCNALANGASSVTLMQSNAQVPAAQGGSVTTGLYYLTALTWYNGQTGPAGASVQLTLDVANGTLQSVATQNAQTDRASFAWKTSQTAWAMAETCPGNAQSSANYTATQTLLKLYFDDGQGNWIEEVFTHQ